MGVKHMAYGALREDRIWRVGLVGVGPDTKIQGTEPHWGHFLECGGQQI